MLIDDRKRNFVEVGTLCGGEGFVFDGVFYMTIEKETHNYEDAFEGTYSVPAVDLDDGSYYEFNNDLLVERCQYEIHVIDC